MAELGDIEQVDSNRGISPVGRGAELAALGTGLQLTKKVADEAVKAQLIGNLNEVESDALAQAAELEAQRSQGGEDFSFRGDPELNLAARGMATKAHANITKLRQAADQATSGSRRDAAILRMQRELNQAKNRWPWAADDLERAAGSYTRGNPSLAYLAALDASTAEQQAAVQEDIDQIKKYAYDTLGMDPAQYVFGTKNWSRKYAQMSELEQRKLLNEDRVAAMRASTEFQATEAEETWAVELTKSEGEIHQVMVGIGGAITEQLELRRIVEQRGDTAAGAELAQEWATNVEQYKNQLIQAKIAIDKNFPIHFPGAQAQSEAGVRSRALAEQKKEDIDILIAALDSGVQEVGDVIKSMDLVVTAQRLEEAPTVKAMFQTMAYPGADNSVALWTKWDFGYSSPEFQALIAKGFTKEVPFLFGGHMEASAEMPQGSTLTTDDYRRALDNQNAISNSPSPTGMYQTKDPADVPFIAATGVIGVLDSWQEGTSPMFVPETAATSSWNLAKNLDALTRTGIGGFEDSDKLKNRIWERLASPRTAEVLEMVPGGFNNTGFKFTREVLDKYLRTQDPIMARSDELVAGLTLKPIPDTETTLAQVLLLNVDKIDEGQISFQVDREAVNKLWPQIDGVDVPDAPFFVRAFGLDGVWADKARELEMDLNRNISNFRQRRVNGAIAHMRVAAERLTKEVSETMRVEALIDVGKNGGIDYEEALRTTGLLRPFEGRTLSQNVEVVRGGPEGE